MLFLLLRLTNNFHHFHIIDNVTKGKTYTFSAYYRTTNAAKAKLRVTFMDENGAAVNAESLTEELHGTSEGRIKSCGGV